MPLLVVGLFWSSQASADAEAVVGDGQAADVETVQVWVAGVGSVLPAGSVARTRKVWEPWVSPVYWRGEVHAVKAAPSRAHSNVDPVSSAVKVKRRRGAGGRVGRAAVDRGLRRRVVSIVQV